MKTNIMVVLCALVALSASTFAHEQKSKEQLMTLMSTSIAQGFLTTFMEGACSNVIVKGTKVVNDISEPCIQQLNELLVGLEEREENPRVCRPG